MSASEYSESSSPQESEDLSGENSPASAITSVPLLKTKRLSKVKEIIKPENPCEALVWYVMINQYLFFILGATYIVGSVMGWLLLFSLLLRLWFQSSDTPEHRKTKIPLILWVWVAGMLLEEVALIFGHLDFRLPLALMIKSSIGWAKGWASLALYPLAGCLPIRPKIIYRATCIVCFHTLLIAPILIIAPIIHLPEILYVSPLKAVGGPSPSFFDVSLYEINLGGEVRTRLFTPWGPALGFLANIYLLLVLQEKDKKWRYCGVIGALFMAYVCKSRLALISAVITPIIVYIVMNLSRSYVLFILGIAGYVAGISSTRLIDTFNTFMAKVKGARADSTRVRADLKEIAFVRGQEAPIWGHGVVEPGPHLVEYMPIGSHHTWAGLMFVKGIAGILGLAIPMILSFVVLLIRAQKHKVAGVGFGVLLILAFYTIGENLEVLVYLYWPGLIIMGMGFGSQPTRNPETEFN